MFGSTGNGGIIAGDNAAMVFQKRDRKSIRLANYDYSRNGYYFVTVCTKNRYPWFGKISDTEMILAKPGQIVFEQWNWLKNQYKYVDLDEYIIMPDHFHGIIVIGNDIVGAGRDRPLHKIKPLPQLIGAFKTRSSKLIHQNGFFNFQWQRNYFEHVIRNEHELGRIRMYINTNAIKHNIKASPIGSGRPPF